MASSSSFLYLSQGYAQLHRSSEMFVSPVLNNLSASSSSPAPQTDRFWCVTVGRVRTVFQMPNLLVSCCNVRSLLLVLSLVETAKSCFSALLLPFPYLKVVIFSHQSSLNLNKPNSFPGRSCFLDLITFFLWILSRALVLQLWICTAEQSRRKIPWACKFSSLERKFAVCKFRISWFLLICSLLSWCL